MSETGSSGSSSTPTASSALVVAEAHGDVTLLTIDDGKANALSFEMMAAIDAALDDAEEAGQALIIAGREGKLCAGFDLRSMSAGPERAKELVVAGGELFMRLYMYPRPLVMACTGHALAAGAALLLTADERISAEGPFKLGFNEIQIGLPTPRFLWELAQARLERRAFIPSTLMARIHDPAAARDAGFLDRVVSKEELASSALEAASRLAALPRSPYASSKRAMRKALVERVLATLHEDIARFIDARDL